MTRALSLLGAAAAVLALSSCTVGPNYKRPVVNAPAVFRGASPNDMGPASFGDEKWSEVFQDATLRDLIQTAVRQNFDVRIAATRITQAQAQLVITRANQFPNIGAGPTVTGARQPPIAGVFPAYSYVAEGLAASGSWNIDFWGRYRRATEAARANLLAVEWSRRAVLSTLVENVATAYFQLRELDLELDIANRTLASRRQSLGLTQTLERGGAVSLLDVRQAEQLVETAAETIPSTQRLIAQQEDQLSILLGQNPSEMPRGQKLTEQPMPAAIPAGLPSSLLERRPDIEQAEAQLIAANAEIGVARAQLFPQVSLTGSGGLESIGLTNLFVGSARAWNYTAAATQPIFNAGALRANVRLAQAQREQALLTYEQAIQQAFREVSDSLIAYQRLREFREHQQALTTAAQGAANLSEVRYQGGVSNYLEVLTNETNYFSAQLNLARSQLDERLAVVQLYNALGGGWQL